jgi:hypothetical protein
MAFRDREAADDFNSSDGGTTMKSYLDRSAFHHILRPGSWD